MIISTHTITEEYCEGTLVIAVLETDRGGTTFSTISAVEEIARSRTALYSGKRTVLGSLVEY